MTMLLDDSLFTKIYENAYDLVPQVIDGSDPSLVILLKREYRKLYRGTHIPEERYSLPPQFIRSSDDGLRATHHVVLRRDDFENLQTSQFPRARLFEIHFPDKNLRALAHWWDDNNHMTVLRGSQMAEQHVPSLSEHNRTQRERILALGAVKLVDGRYIFQECVDLPSPSSAASVLSGYQVDGPKDWRKRNGEHLPCRAS